MVDAFVKDYDVSSFMDGEYLVTSYIIKRGNKKVRYDFVFVNDTKICEYRCKYDLIDAVDAGSDHAAVILEIDD